MQRSKGGKGLERVRIRVFGTNGLGLAILPITTGQEANFAMLVTP